MTRLTKNETATHRAWLSQWRNPGELACYVGAVNNHMGSQDFFNQSGVDFLRDAWVAAEFGELRQASAVRLVISSDRWPDFELRFDERIEQYECVEADIPGRRRGDEYKNCHRIKDDPVEDWIERAEQVPTAIKTAVEKKICKNYAIKISLLININIGEFGIRQQEIESGFHEQVKPRIKALCGGVDTLEKAGLRPL